MYKCPLLCTVILLSCAQQPTPSTSAALEAASISAETNDCPEGIKTGCNVPDVTQADLDANQQKIQTCTEECIQVRQAESIGAQQIQHERHNQCMEEHFMGQLEVITEVLLGPSE